MNRFSIIYHYSFSVLVVLYTRDRKVCPGWRVYEIKCLQRAGMRKGGEPLAFQYFILVIKY